MQREDAVLKPAKLAAAGLLAFSTATVAADADECSGRSHTGATVAGAAGGGIIAGVAGAGAAGVIGGAVLGGLTGNAVARHVDCNNQRGRYYHKGQYYNHRRYYDGRYHYW
jgi:hypothetical protein